MIHAVVETAKKAAIDKKGSSSKTIPSGSIISTLKNRKEDVCVRYESNSFFLFFLKERIGKHKYVIKEISIAISIDFMNAVQKILVAASGSKKGEYGPTCMDRSV